MRQVRTNRARQEQYQCHRRRDPDGAVKVRVAIKHVEEVRAREDGRVAAADDLVGVDVEELLVERDAPEEALGRAAGGARGRAGEEAGACVGGDFIARLAVFEVLLYVSLVEPVGGWCNVLDVWNSRSSWRSVWPKSPLKACQWLQTWSGPFQHISTSVSTSTTTSYPLLDILRMCSATVAFKHTRNT